MKKTIIKFFCEKEMSSNRWNKHIGLVNGCKNFCKICLNRYNDFIKNEFESCLATACECKDLNELFKIKCYGYSTIYKKYEETLKDKIVNGEIPYVQDPQFEKELDILCKKYINLSLNEYIHSHEVHHATYKRSSDTLYRRYGYRNYGQSDTHKKNMRIINGQTKNPFCSIDFKYREYIRGKSVLPEDKTKYLFYVKKVWNLTNININKIEYTGKCYYTEIPIYKNINPNSYNHASIDHKESILSCFLKGLPEEYCANPNNLCWTSKYFNSIKGSKTESEIRLFGFIERFLEIWEKIKLENNILE